MDSRKQYAFVSGANRGIGYELVQQLANQSYLVIAGYRNEAKAQTLLHQANSHSQILPFKVDTTVEDDLQTLHNFTATQFGSLDLLINNAGINLKREADLNELAWPDLTHHLDVNVGGPFLTTKYMYPLIKKGIGKKVVNISSRLGSIDLSGGGSIPYRLSKTSLNMLTRQQAIAYQADGITVVSISPGWVQTDMGGNSAPLRVQDSVGQILQQIDKLALAQSGQFIDLDGSSIPY
ncbi:MAG: SDR family oxidoreductase [Chloroflexota bacterium]